MYFSLFLNIIFPQEIIHLELCDDQFFLLFSVLICSKVYYDQVIKILTHLLNIYNYYYDYLFCLSQVGLQFTR